MNWNSGFTRWILVAWALQAYKYQPRLEKRFQQFKHIHHGASLLFKKLERIEATMFAFFIALMIQALIERQVRQTMADRKIPEDHP